MAGAGAVDYPQPDTLLYFMLLPQAGVNWGLELYERVRCMFMADYSKIHMSFVVTLSHWKALDLDEESQLGCHLQPGATEYFSMHESTPEAEERYRWYLHQQRLSRDVHPCFLQRVPNPCESV